MKRFLILTVITTLLAACSELQYYSNSSPSNGDIAPVFDSGRGVNRWLTELHETRGMSPEMLQQTLDAREREYLANPTDDGRMRLALLLATAEEPVGDRKRALKFVNGIDAEAGSDSEQELVAILRQYLELHLQNGRKISTLLKQLTEQNSRIEELEQQLQALTTIEQTIQQRDKSGAAEDGL